MVKWSFASVEKRYLCHVCCEMTINAFAQVCIMWVEMFYCGSLGIWRIAEKQQRGLRLPQVILPSDLPC